MVMPSWVGDTVMATPALRALREGLRGWFIGGLMRPELAGLLDGTPFLDEVHLDRAAGMMGPKRVAGRLRMRGYSAAILLTNSFSTALIARLAGIPARFGYDRDGRGLLLTDLLVPARRRDVEPYARSRTDPGAWAPTPACEYYFDLARRFLEVQGAAAPGSMGPMELAVSEAERAEFGGLLERAGAPAGRLVILNPGGNNPAKRWPPSRFAAVAEELVRRGDVTVLVSGSPREAELCAEIVGGVAAGSRGRVFELGPILARSSSGAPPLSLLRSAIGRAALMITNDTGPRHIAAALGVPVVSLFGPTDHRWTRIPFARERIIVADPSLPEEEVANDHPERCSIDRISVEEVLRAADGLLG